MVQRKTLVIDTGHQAFDELDAADIPSLSATYQPVDSDLTAIAALTTTAFGRGLLELANAGALLAAAGAQGSDATLTALAGLTIAANSLSVGTGADAFTQTTFAANTFPARASTGNLVAKTITDFGLGLVDDADAAAARVTIGAAPLTVDYLVGTADSGLSGEIAVGTTPGGELGGTWASPTVDATHSGSAHIALGATEPGAVLTTSSGSAGAGATASKVDHSHDLGFDDATSNPLAVSTAAADGTEGSAARKDHVHAHEAAHINHDTTWAAKGDIIAGTANDTASVLTVGANDTVLTADSTAGTGLKWAASASGAARDEENLILHMRTYA